MALAKCKPFIVFGSIVVSYQPGLALEKVGINGSWSIGWPRASISETISLKEQEDIAQPQPLPAQQSHKPSWAQLARTAANIPSATRYVTLFYPQYTTTFRS
jgi:hypothetical protein